MAHNIQTMAYYKKEPWHGRGTRFDQRLTSAQMIKAAGLDWLVEKRPARGAIIDKKGRASRYEIVRVPRVEKGEHEVLYGVVTDRYEPLQNQEAFEFFDPIISDEMAYYETAGALGDGGKIWVLAKMPDCIEVVRGDECMKYLLLSNTHTGSGAVNIKFTAVRVVCQNTLMLSMRDGQKTYQVRHTRRMVDRMHELSEIIAEAQEIYLRTAELFKRLAHVGLNEKRMNEFLEGVFPKTAAQKKEGKEPPKWSAVKERLEVAPDLRMQGVSGTMWALYNAVTNFEDYRVAQGSDEETTDQRLERVWFGSSADVKLKALLQAQKTLAAA